MRLLRTILRQIWFWLPILVVLIFAYATIYYLLTGRIAERERGFRQRGYGQQGLLLSPGGLIPASSAARETAASAASPPAPSATSPARA